VNKQRDSKETEKRSEGDRAPRLFVPPDPSLEGDELRSLQQFAGNLPLQRRRQDARSSGLLLQRAPEAGAAPSPDTVVVPDAGLLVEDTVAELAPGQMRRSEFLAQLKAAVSGTVEQALAGTIWSVAGCPYIEHWFGYYAGRDSKQIERALRRYAPETAGARSAAAYIPLVAARVRAGVSTWLTTGEVAGVPEFAANDAAAPGGSDQGSSPGIVGSVVQGIGSLFFKAEDAQSRPGRPGERIDLDRGRALDGGVRSRMESAFEAPFDNVRVHTDGLAAGATARLGARAFTVGRDLVFGADEYRPGTAVGEALIAHELAHVLQQRGGAGANATGVDAAPHPELEEDADRSAVGAVVGLWGGLEGLAAVPPMILPRLRSGLRLQRCKSERQKEIERLAGLQSGHLEQKRQDMEAKKQKEAEEAAKKAGVADPKVKVTVTNDDVLEEEVKKSGFTTHPTTQWDQEVAKGNEAKWNADAKAAWDSLVASVKGTELEKNAAGASYTFQPKVALEHGWYAWQKGTEKILNFGMSWVQNVQADPKNGWPNLAHELGGHLEYGTTYASEIMRQAIKSLSPDEQKKWQNEKRQEFFDAYEYPETEIFSALRERRYAVPEAGGKAPTYGGLSPDANVPQRLQQMKDLLHPEVAKAVLKELKRRVDAHPEILARDKKFFVDQVAKVFGYTP
jgi:Domain of unknown function (DUF4157)